LFQEIDDVGGVGNTTLVEKRAVQRRPGGIVSWGYGSYNFSAEGAQHKDQGAG